MRADKAFFHRRRSSRALELTLSGAINQPDRSPYATLPRLGRLRATNAPICSAFEASAGGSSKTLGNQDRRGSTTYSQVGLKLAMTIESLQRRFPPLHLGKTAAFQI